MRLTFGILVDTRVHVDAAAALGILERRGVGRVRHLDVGALWLQEQTLRQRIEFAKVKGTLNPADLMTKHLPRETLELHANGLGIAFRDGRSATTAQLHGVAQARASMRECKVAPPTNTTTTTTTNETTTTGAAAATTTTAATGDALRTAKLGLQGKDVAARSFERSASSATLAGKAVAISSVVESSVKSQSWSRQKSTGVIGSVGLAGANDLDRASLAIAAESEGIGEVRVPPMPLPAGNRRRQRRFDPAWVEHRPRSWQAEIRNARAHRLPPGVGWSDVASRVTTDMKTGEVLENTLESGDLLNQDFALRRLDKVRDIRVEVIIRDAREMNLQVAIPFESTREKWGDIECE